MFLKCYGKLIFYYFLKFIISHHQSSVINGGWLLKTENVSGEWRLGGR